MKFFLKVIFCVCLFQSCGSKGQKMNGVSYVASGDPTTQVQVEKIKEVHFNYAAIMPFAFIRNIEEPILVFNTEQQWYGERRDGVKQYIKVLHKNGVAVMLKPQIWIWRGEFTGYLKMANEDDWEKFENSYREFILLYAKLAAETGVEVLCIGTELEQFIMHRPKFWNALIAEIQEVYKGKLTYAANWDEYKRVPFWEQLDYIGVDAYFPISDKKTPTVEEARAGWQQWKVEMQNVSEAYNKPILFTEYGYRSVDYAGKEPWKSDRDMMDVNLTAQANLTQAVFDEMYQEPWFAGGFIWKWFIDHEKVGGPKNSQFTPQNKPAEQTIKNFFRSLK